MTAIDPVVYSRRILRTHSISTASREFAPIAQTASRATHESIEERSLRLGTWANLLMAGAGVGAAYASHSDALLVDGLYSGVNFLSAIIAARISTC
jgi:predicted Co/Zn/Cd cation transporter (cation efflux family)